MPEKWLAFIQRVGVPTVFALILLGMLTGFVPNPISTTAAQVQALYDDRKCIVRLLALICDNTAQNAYVRAECRRVAENGH